MTKLSIFDKIEEAKKYTVLSHSDKIWAFLTKLKKRKNSRSSHKMTKLNIFDKIEDVKKNTRASQKMTKLSIFDKIEKAKKVYGAF